MILSGFVAALLLALPGADPPASGVPLFLDDASSGRARAECVKAALPLLRQQLARDGRVRLVEAREEAALVVDVRECGSRWETKTSGEVGVVVAVGGSPRTPTGSGTGTQAELEPR